MSHVQWSYDILLRLFFDAAARKNSNFIEGNNIESMLLQMLENLIEHDNGNVDAIEPSAEQQNYLHRMKQEILHQVVLLDRKYRGEYHVLQKKLTNSEKEYHDHFEKYNDLDTVYMDVREMAQNTH
jgi:hypothetical protein